MKTSDPIKDTLTPPIDPFAAEGVAEHVERLKSEDSGFAEAYRDSRISQELARTLIGYRMEKRISQVELARQLRMTSAEISRLENGEHSPTARTIDHVLSGIGKRVAIVDRELALS